MLELPTSSYTLCWTIPDYEPSSFLGINVERNQSCQCPLPNSKSINSYKHSWRNQSTWSSLQWKTLAWSFSHFRLNLSTWNSRTIKVIIVGYPFPALTCRKFGTEPNLTIHELEFAMPQSRFRTPLATPSQLSNPPLTIPFRTPSKYLIPPSNPPMRIPKRPFKDLIKIDGTKQWRRKFEALNRTRPGASSSFHLAEKPSVSNGVTVKYDAKGYITKHKAQTLILHNWIRFRRHIRSCRSNWAYPYPILGCRLLQLPIVHPRTWSKERVSSLKKRFCDLQKVSKIPQSVLLLLKSSNRYTALNNHHEFGSSTS